MKQRKPLLHHFDFSPAPDLSHPMRRDALPCSVSLWHKVAASQHQPHQAQLIEEFSPIQSNPIQTPGYAVEPPCSAGVITSEIRYARKHETMRCSGKTHLRSAFFLYDTRIISKTFRHRSAAASRNPPNTSSSPRRWQTSPTSGIDCRRVQSCSDQGVVVIKLGQTRWSTGSLSMKTTLPTCGRASENIVMASNTKGLERPEAFRQMPSKEPTLRLTIYLGQPPEA